jgi:hypothetical protein
MLLQTWVNIYQHTERNITEYIKLSAGCFNDIDLYPCETSLPQSLHYVTPKSTLSHPPECSLSRKTQYGTSEN